MQRIMPGEHPEHQPLLSPPSAQASIMSIGRGWYHSRHHPGQPRQATTTQNLTSSQNTSTSQKNNVFLYQAASILTTAPHQASIMSISRCCYHPNTAPGKHHEHQPLLLPPAAPPRASIMSISRCSYHRQHHTGQAS